MVPMMAHQEVIFLELQLKESLVDPSEGSLMVLIMAHHIVPCTGPNHGALLSPDQNWLLRRCSLNATAVAEAVLRTRGAAEKVSSGKTISAMRRDC